MELELDILNFGKWTPPFKPRSERTTKHLVWVKMLDLVLKLEQEDVFKAMVDRIKTLLEVDD